MGKSSRVKSSQKQKFTADQIEAVARSGGLKQVRHVIKHSDAVENDIKLIFGNACYYGEMVIVAYLFEQYPASVKTVALDNLAAACLRKHFSVVAYLIDNDIFPKRMVILDCAVQGGNIDIVRLLLTKMTVDKEQQAKVLALAEKHNSHDVVLHLKTIWNVTRDVKSEELIEVIKKSDVVALERLLEADDNKDVENNLWFCLNEACIYGKIQIVAYLVEQKKTAINTTCLEHACTHGNLACVAYLFVNHKFTYSEAISALNVVAQEGHISMLQLFDGPLDIAEIAQKLITVATTHGHHEFVNHVKEVYVAQAKFRKLGKSIVETVTDCFDNIEVTRDYKKQKMTD